MKTGVPILTDNPREVGADRVVNTLAAFTRFGGPAIVVDFGTGTNFDVVSEAGEFLGGVIAPGLQISAGGLFGRTARLTRVGSAAAAVADRQDHGRGDPVGADLRHRRRGRRHRRADPRRARRARRTVVATGGLAPVVIPHCRTVDHHEPWLTLEGLRLVFEKNVDD